MNWFRWFKRNRSPGGMTGLSSSGMTGSDSDSSTLNRRQMLAAAMVFFAAACKSGKKITRTPTANALGNSDTGGTADDDKTTDNTQCGAVSKYNYNKKSILEDATQVVQEVPENLKPSLKFYGDSQSAIIVLELPYYNNLAQTLEVITVFRPSGDPLCEKRIEQVADIDVSNRLRPVVFENIAIKNDKSLIILFKESSSNTVKYTKYAMDTQISFNNSFNGKPVKSSNDPLYSQYRAYPNFGLDVGSEFSLPSASDGTISLSIGAKYLGAPSLKGFILADMMNRPIAIDGEGGSDTSPRGETFNDLENYYQFFCYKKADDGEYYVRTLVRVF